MADAVYTSVFPSFLSVAAQHLASIPPSRWRPWDVKLSEYLRASALERAFSKLGEFAAAEEDYNHADSRLRAKYGPNYLRNPTAITEIEPYAKRLDAATDVWAERYADRLVGIAKELLEVPAPDEAALLAKIDIFNREELHLYNDVNSSAWESVAVDAERLSQGDLV